jgi:hypothetical protein
MRICIGTGACMSMPADPRAWYANPWNRNPKRVESRKVGKTVKLRTFLQDFASPPTANPSFTLASLASPRKDKPKPQKAQEETGFVFHIAVKMIGDSVCRLIV